MTLSIVPTLQALAAVPPESRQELLGPGDGNHGNHAGDDADVHGLELHAVTDLPTFEGQVVDEMRVKLPGVANLDLDGEAHPLDELVHLVVTARVTRVDHHVDARSGRLVRHETLRVMEAAEAPWHLACAMLDDPPNQDNDTRGRA